MYQELKQTFTLTVVLIRHNNEPCSLGHLALSTWLCVPGVQVPLPSYPVKEKEWCNITLR